MPDDEYLLRIGQLVYMVSSIEGLILFDLPGMATYLPEKLNAGALAGETMGTLARALTDAAPSIEDGDVRAYVDFAGRVLSQTSSIRNDLLHARPATVDGQSRLFRWKPRDRRGAGVAFPITDDWLEEMIDMMSEASVQMNNVRPLGKNTAFTKRPAD